MLEELRKINCFCDKNDIILFLTSIIGRQRLSRDDIQKICEHSSRRFIQNIDAFLLYCEYLELIIVDEKIYLSAIVDKILDDPIKLNDFIITNTVSKMFSNSAFNTDMFIYDVLDNRFIFKNEKLPLNYFHFRNMLVSQGLFEINRSNEKSRFFVVPKYEKLISSFCQESKKSITIEQLRKKLEVNEQAGEKAELFVLTYEKQRITNDNLKKMIRRISDIDVSAGYDIVSINSNESKWIDRFIEVKAISNSDSFYWSKNEFDVARLKGEQYYLYLIDLQKIDNSQYSPKIINDPANLLFESADWLVEPQSFHIWHV